MAGAGGPTLGSYSPLTGFIFVFNLIVGAGALTIPHAFAQVQDCTTLCLDLSFGVPV